MLSSRHCRRTTLSKRAYSSSSEVLSPGGRGTTGVSGWQVCCHLAPVTLSSNSLAPGHSPNINCMMLPSQRSHRSKKMKNALTSEKSRSRCFCQAKRSRYILDRENLLTCTPELHQRGTGTATRLLVLLSSPSKGLV